MVQLTSRTQLGCQRNVPLCRGSRSCIRSTAVRCFKGGPDQIGSKPNTTLRLNFKIPYRVNFGQSLGLVGSGDSLGNWDPKRTVQMKWTDGDWWTVEVSIPQGGTLDLEYKYVVVNQDGNIGYWKPGSNYRVTLPLQPSGAKIPKRVKVADAWDDSFKKVDIEETEVQGAASSSTGGGDAGKPSAPSEQQKQPEPRPQAVKQPSSLPPVGGTAAAAAPAQPAEPAQVGPPVAEATAASNGASPPSQTPAAAASVSHEVTGSDKSPKQPRATSPRTAPPSFAAATSIPVIHPSLLAEQERLEDGVRNSLEDLQAQMDKHQQLRERTDDPAAVEILVADRIVAAANNRVVAYNKALKAVQEYNRLPPSASAPKEGASDVEK